MRDYLRTAFPDVERTGSDFSTPWGACDLRETGRWGIEVKNWKDTMAAIREGVPQVERNAAWKEHAPALVALRYRKPVHQALVVCRLEDFVYEVRDAERYRRQ